MGKFCPVGFGAESMGLVQLQGFADLLKSFGPGRIGAMVAVAAALVGFFGFVILRVTSPQMTTLFTDLSYEDSSAIIKDLDRQAIPYEIRNDGAIIMVPKDKVTKLRLKLAESSLPKGGGVGYEIFDKSDALGATNFVQNINHLRALEGELARTIRAIDRVQFARVHLVLPERPLFSRETPEPSASIVVRVRGSLEPPQVRAIRHLVASAVNGLKPQRVSIVDENGQLLANGGEDANSDAVNGDERRAAFEKRMRSQIETIVSSVVGSGRARVQLTADFDYNKITETSDKFDPESKVVRSTQSREELTSSSDGKENQVSVANELPGGQRQPDATTTPKDQSKKSEEIVNYEISRTTKTEVVEAGRVNRISVAVLVDGVYGKDEKGEVTYKPRTKEELDTISQLVRSAIGFDQKRGDQVQVVNLRFADAPAAIPVPEPEGWLPKLQFTKDDVMNVIELGAMTFLGLIVLFTVVRPLVRKVLTSEPERSSSLVTQDGAAASTTPGANPPQLTASNTAKLIDVAQVQGQVHAQSVHRVGELAEKNPHETVSIIRQWLTEPAPT